MINPNYLYYKSSNYNGYELSMYGLCTTYEILSRTDHIFRFESQMSESDMICIKLHVICQPSLSGNHIIIR
jgi:hypothetical protein